MTRPPTRVALIALLALGLLAAGCSGDSSDAASSSTSSERPATAPGGSSTTTTAASTTSAPSAEEYKGDDFYDVPAALPEGPHGTLIRYEVVSPSVLPGATTYRIMYTSESLEGDAIAVTGTAIVPEVAAPADGRPILTVAHGTSGIADECAPSKDPGSELGLLADEVADGWLIAATDYEGLGTPGRHPYLVGPSEGRGVLDAARAAGSLPDADPGTELAVAGYSQGGHGALWAGQLASEWAPELDLVGTFAGAPATEMNLILLGAPIGFKLMVIAGYEAAYPEADPSLYLTPKGVELLDTVDTGCTRAVFAASAGIPNAELIRADRSQTGPWRTLPTANDPGAVAVDAPILVIHSDQDDTVPIELSGLLLNRLCKVGQVVERRVIEGGGGHGAAAPGAIEDGLAWLEGLVAGTGQARSSCPSTPRK